MFISKKVCVQHTQTFKHTQACTLSLQRNEEKGLWRPWLAVVFAKVKHTHTHTLMNV